ncbi:MAG: hypothetical protein IPQ07_13460 [Myxococcales bacterium]|nr:hypothetical protein [Myxococcales bacterium]
MPKYQPATDYVDEAATEIDHAPHWSLHRASLQRMRAEVPSRVSPPPVPVRMPPALQVSSVRRAPLPPPARPFYSYAETAAAQHLDTERVAPLPMSSLRPTWLEWLATSWTRFAAPACGAIAGLILVVGYLAYSSQRGAGIATAAAPAGPIVMPAEIAMMAPAPSEDAAEAIAETPVEVPAREPTVSPISPVAKVIAQTRRGGGKRVASIKRPSSSSSKRRPIRLNDSTPLGDLRPSRSR